MVNADGASGLPRLVVVLDRDDVAGVDEDELVFAGHLEVDDRDRAAADADDFFVGFLGADLDLVLAFVAGVDDRHRGAGTPRWAGTNTGVRRGPVSRRGSRAWSVRWGRSRPAWARGPSPRCSSGRHR